MEHRVVIDFGTVVTARLVCPESRAGRPNE